MDLFPLHPSLYPPTPCGSKILYSPNSIWDTPYPRIILDIFTIQCRYPDSPIFALNSTSEYSICQINKTYIMPELCIFDSLTPNLHPIPSSTKGSSYPFALDPSQRYQAFLLSSSDLFDWCGPDSNAFLFEAYMLRLENIRDGIIDQDALYVDSDVTHYSASASALIHPGSAENSDHPRLITPLLQKKKSRRHKKIKRTFSEHNSGTGFEPFDFA